jgi:hypothetical protein
MVQDLVVMVQDLVVMVQDLVVVVQDLVVVVKDLDPTTLLVNQSKKPGASRYVSNDC